ARLASSWDRRARVSPACGGSGRRFTSQYSRRIQTHPFAQVSMKQSRVRGRPRAPKSKVPPPRYQLLPALDEQAFRALKADIADRGVLVPIERDEHGVLLDGHHRARAIEELRAEGHFVADPPVIVRAGF